MFKGVKYYQIMEEYIVEFPYSIPDILCDEIISFFETEQGRYPGCTLSGVNKSIKDTTDFIIPKAVLNNTPSRIVNARGLREAQLLCNNVTLPLESPPEGGDLNRQRCNKLSHNDWTKIEKFLYKELQGKLKKYIDRLTKKSYQPENNNNYKFHFFDNNDLTTENFMVQKYVKKEGKYVYHNDGWVDYGNKKHRVITFLWYLNTVDEGGQTEMWENTLIRPEKGKLLLFPASWCFPHRGIMPISSDKYIITGWLYTSFTPLNNLNRTSEGGAVQCSRATLLRSNCASRNPVNELYQAPPERGRPDSNLHGCKKADLVIESGLENTVTHQSIQSHNNDCKHNISSDILLPMQYDVPKNCGSHNTRCNFMVVDNFYSNPDEVRNFALTLSYSKHDYHPGKRTQTFANETHKQKFEHILRHVAGKIIRFSTVDDSNNTVENGVFQYTTASDRSWIHKDSYNTNWAGIIYLTPNAPSSAGTGIFELIDGDYTNADKYSQDITKWKLVNNIGNIYNRLVLFRSDQYHMSMDYFGSSIEDGRLFQVFFFSTEY